MAGCHFARLFCLGRSFVRVLESEKNKKKQKQKPPFVAVVCFWFVSFTSDFPFKACVTCFTDLHVLLVHQVGEMQNSPCPKQSNEDSCCWLCYKYDDSDPT